MTYRVEDGFVIVEGTRTQGFGLSAESLRFEDKAEIVPHEEFERLLRDNEPTGYFTIGFNRGAAIDGLKAWKANSGIRYLIRTHGASFERIYADADSIPVASA